MNGPLLWMRRESLSGRGRRCGGEMLPWSEGLLCRARKVEIILKICTAETFLRKVDGSYDSSKGKVAVKRPTLLS